MDGAVANGSGGDGILCDMDGKLYGAGQPDGDGDKRVACRASAFRLLSGMAKNMKREQYPFFPL